MDAKYRTVVAAAALMAVSSPAWAQSSNRDPGWEYGLDLVYQDSTNLSFKGGSTLDVGDDMGATFTFGYRFNPRVELQFALDYQTADYDATIQSADTPGLSVDVRGDYEQDHRQRADDDQERRSEVVVGVASHLEPRFASARVGGRCPL